MKNAEWLNSSKIKLFFRNQFRQTLIMNIFLIRVLTDYTLVLYKRTVQNTTLRTVNEFNSNDIFNFKSKYLCNLIVYTAKGVHRNKYRGGGANMPPHT